MKRYGFKFRSSGSGYSSAVSMRFMAFVLAFVCGFLVYIVDKDGFGSFLPFAVVYFILGVGLEFFPKTFAIMVFIVSLISSILIVYYLFSSVGECIDNCYELREWHSRQGIEHQYNTTGRAIYFTVLVVSYHSLMAYFAFISMRSRSTVHDVS